MQWPCLARFKVVGVFFPSPSVVSLYCQKARFVGCYFLYFFNILPWICAVMADFDVPFYFYIVSFVTHALATVFGVCYSSGTEPTSKGFMTFLLKAKPSFSHLTTSPAREVVVLRWITSNCASRPSQVMDTLIRCARIKFFLCLRVWITHIYQPVVTEGGDGLFIIYTIG